MGLFHPGINTFHLERDGVDLNLSAPVSLHQSRSSNVQVGALHAEPVRLGC